MLDGQQQGVLRKDIRANYLTYLFLGSIDTFLSVMILGNEKLNEARQQRFTEGILNVFLHGALVKSSKG